MTADILVNFFVNHVPLGMGERQGLIESVGLQERARLLVALLEMSSSSGASRAPSRAH